MLVGVLNTWPTIAGIRNSEEEWWSIGKEKSRRFRIL